MNAARRDLAGTEARLAYTFADPDLLERALTHPSARGQNRRGETYQRFEFLGDRVLGLAVAHMLLDAFPRADEGDLSRRYNLLVRKETCAEIAADLGLGPALRLGEGEAASGGRRKGAILGDAMEAIIAAIYLDGGWEPAFAFVERLWQERMRNPPQPLRDAKTALQEWAHAMGYAPPVYREVERSGPDHAPRFRIRVGVEGAGEGEAEGWGGSKRLAEQSAAEALLEANGARSEERDDRHSA